MAASSTIPRNVLQRDAALSRLTSRLEVKGGAVGGVAVSAVLHVGIAVSIVTVMMLNDLWSWHRGLLGKLQTRILDEYTVDVVKEEEPPPPKEPEPEPPKEEVKPETPPPPAEKAPPTAAPQAAAQAAKVLAAEPAPDEPLDMTNVMVQGTGDTYKGGTTSAAGTGQGKVTGPAAAVGGTTGGAPTAQGGGVDKSRVAGNSGSSDWDCPFPPEADALQEDLAFVSIKVMVGADGRAQKVTVTKDPGHGFAREARTCAMTKKFTTALDAAGNPIPGETKEFRVRFER